MTQVAFHFGAADRLHYACRLLRKIVSTGARALVWAEPETLTALDAGLWSLSPTDFVAHDWDQAPGTQVQRAAVVLASSLGPGQGCSVLVNLHPEFPQAYAGFARVIEIVSAQGDDRDDARSKWRQYTADGHTIVRHDLQSKEPTP